jgi:hypothetical protein
MSSSERTENLIPSAFLRKKVPAKKFIGTKVGATGEKKAQ